MDDSHESMYGYYRTKEKQMKKMTRNEAVAKLNYLSKRNGPKGILEILEALGLIEFEPEEKSNREVCIVESLR